MENHLRAETVLGVPIYSTAGKRWRAQFRTITKRRESQLRSAGFQNLLYRRFAIGGAWRVVRPAG
jgi:hypothetical protein